MTFYDDEEIEENENLEGDQSEENELAEGEQDENNAGSDEVGEEDQYDGIDNLSSKGTMGSSRQRHGSRQRQINKARNMMNKGKNVAQRGKQVGKKVASSAKGQASKKAAEEGAKKAAVAAAKAGAKAGASAASAGAGAGAAAGGAGVAMGPCCGGCLVLAIIIFLLIGIVGFFQNMPDMILDKIYEWFNTKLDSWRIAFGEDPGSPGMVSNDDIVDTANYILDMGYDLKGYGFLAEVESDEDRENNIIKQEIYYTFLFYNPSEWGPLQSNFMIQYDGNQVWTAGSVTNPNNFQRKEIGLGENIDEQIKIIYAGATDSSGENWIGHSAEITVRVTKKEDDVEYTKVLQRKISNATLDDSSGIITYEVGESEYIDSDFIRAYLATDNRTYMFNDGKTLNWFQQLFHGLFSEDRFTKSVNGLINIDPEMVESIEGDSGEEDNNTENYDGEIHLVREEKKLYIPPGKDVEQYEPDYIYDLNGWAGKYGKPLEFLLTLHLATLAPDFTYAVALGDERLDTKVNIKFYQTNYSRRLLLNGEDAEESYRTTIIEQINSISFDELGKSIYGDRFTEDVNLLDLGGGDTFIEGRDHLNEIKNELIEAVESKNFSSISRVANVLIGYISGLKGNIDKYQDICYYNETHANLKLYIPYIKSVDNHWYRDLDFKDPEGTILGGYILDINKPGAAPYVDNVEDLKKILATYSNQEGANNLVEVADDFMQIQQEYGINAIFAASVAIDESGAGSADTSLVTEAHNWMSMKGGEFPYNGAMWHYYDSFQEATLHFGSIINKDYFRKGLYNLTGVMLKYNNYQSVVDVGKQMNVFYDRAINELGITLNNEENLVSDAGNTNLQGTQNSGDQPAYEVVSGSSAEVGLVAGELNGYDLDAGEGYTVLRTQAEDLRQVREPVQYDNSAVIKELLGVVDTRVIKKYTDGETVNVEDEDQLAVFEAKVAEKAKYYIYNGTGINEGEKRQISPTKNSLTAMSILESTKTEDAEHLLKNLRELFNDIGFELEDSSEEQATKYEKNTSLQWIFQRYIPSYEWPSQEETPKTEDNEEGSRYIYKVTAKIGDDTHSTNTDKENDNSSNNPTTGTDDVTDIEDTEETVYGFEGGDILVAPGNCVIKKIGEDYLTIQFRNVIKHEIYTKRTWNGSEYVITEINTKDMTEQELEEYKAKKREELGLADDIDPLWDPEVNGTTLTIFGLEVDSGLKVDDTTIIEAGTQIGKTKKGVDIGLLLRGQDLTASDADNEDATENIPSDEEDENEDGEKKLAYLSVPRYIYPPEKTEVIFDMSKLQGLALEVWNDYSAEITEMAIRYGLDPYAIVAVICVESSGRLDSDNGIAFGLMQCHMKYHAIPNKTLVDVDGNRVVKDCSPSAMRGNASLQIECGCHVIRSYIFYPWPDGNWFKGLGSYNKGPSGIKNPSTLEDFRNGYWQKFKKYFWGGDETWAIKREGNTYYQIFTNVNTGEISGTVEVSWPPTGSNTLINGDVLEVAKQLHDYVKNNRFTYGAHYNIKDLGSGTERKVIDCSAYVSWVLYKLGYQEFGTQKNSSWFKSNGKKLCDKYGWQMITPVNSSTLQPGDILVVYGKYINGKLQHHVEIYAGNGRSYSCGSTSSIRADTVKTNFSRYDFALRVTGRGGN